MAVFRKDLYDSERNLLKVESFGIVIEPARGRHQEVAVMTVLANIPAIPFLSQNQQGEAIDRIVNAIGQHTGYYLSGGNHAHVSRATYALEASYVISSADGQLRTWTGAWTRENTVGQLQGYVPLVHIGQLRTCLERFSGPGAIETRFGDLFGHLDTSWTYDGLVSLILNIQLKGTFSALQKKRRVSFL